MSHLLKKSMCPVDQAHAFYMGVSYRGKYTGLQNRKGGLKTCSACHIQEECYHGKRGGGNVMTGRGLTERQKRFVDFYIETGNATESARKAGYSEKTAPWIAQQNLQKLTIQTAIQSRLKEIESSRVANAKEVMQFLTSAMRGETKEEIVVVEGLGDGMSEARIMEKHISAHDRLDAAKALLKRYQDVDSEEAVLRRDKLRAEVEALKTGGTEDTEITFKFERKQDDGS